MDEKEYYKGKAEDERMRADSLEMDVIAMNAEIRDLKSRVKYLEAELEHRKAVESQSKVIGELMDTLFNPRRNK